MRVLQNVGVYGSYLPTLAQVLAPFRSFKEMSGAFIDDGFGSIHLLKPVAEQQAEGFLAVGDHDLMQRQWSKEAGMPESAGLSDILLAQIEEHRAEIFYNMDPVRYGNAFLARLPGCVRRTIAWRAAPSPHTDFLDHDLIVNNYPGLAAQYREMGARTAYFAPAHDPAMDSLAANADRPIDVLFIGAYSRHHRARATALDGVAALAGRHNVVFHLDISRMTKLAETPVGWIGPLRSLRRPKAIRTITRPPLFGRKMYAAISAAKIVINGKVDIAGDDRGNMRVWETMGCGATLISDAGNYPAGMVPGETLATYEKASDLVDTIEQLIAEPDRRSWIAEQAYAMISSRYSREAQWGKFTALAQ